MKTGANTMDLVLFRRIAQASGNLNGPAIDWLGEDRDESFKDRIVMET